MARSAPIASPVRSCSCAALGPMLTSTTSLPGFFSLMRSASSTAISSKGLTTHFTLSVTEPVPSALIFSCVSGSGTRFTVTRIFTGSLLWGGGNSGTKTGLRYNAAPRQSRNARTWTTSRCAGRGGAAVRRRSATPQAFARARGRRGDVSHALARTGRGRGAPRRPGPAAPPTARHDERPPSARFAFPRVESESARQVAGRLHHQRRELLIDALGLEAVRRADDGQSADHVAGVVADRRRDAAHVLHVFAHVDRVAARGDRLELLLERLAVGRRPIGELRQR